MRQSLTSHAAEFLETILFRGLQLPTAAATGSPFLGCTTVFNGYSILSNITVVRGRVIYTISLMMPWRFNCCCVHHEIDFNKRRGVQRNVVIFPG